jgi:hypothetical protein
VTGSNWWRTDGRRLGDYRVDDPHIQADLHGPNSGSVLDSNASRTVLRDEVVAGSNPVSPTIFGRVNAVRVAKKAVAHRLRGLSQVSPADVRPVSEADGIATEHTSAQPRQAWSGDTSTTKDRRRYNRADCGSA